MYDYAHYLERMPELSNWTFAQTKPLIVCVDGSHTSMDMIVAMRQRFGAENTVIFKRRPCDP